MITDSQTNFLYLADTLPTKYPGFYMRFKSVLEQCEIDFALLPSTKDVWAADYMPIQTDLDRFVHFIYDPFYLKGIKKYQKTISDAVAICDEIGIEIQRTNIVLDGGNISRCINKVIMTDRVFIDNPTYERNQLIRELHEHLQVDKLYFIPEQPGDFTGHSDGMVRFVDDDTILINDYAKDKEWFRRSFEIAIHNTGLDCIKIPYNVYSNKRNDQANGDYINYLEMDGCIVVPTFGFKEDEEVVKQFESIFSGKKIVTLDSNDIANEGGVLNCITWNIKGN